MSFVHIIIKVTTPLWALCIRTTRGEGLRALILWLSTVVPLANIDFEFNFNDEFVTSRALFI